LDEAAINIPDIKKSLISKNLCHPLIQITDFTDYRITQIRHLPTLLRGEGRGLLDKVQIKIPDIKKSLISKNLCHPLIQITDFTDYRITQIRHLPTPKG
jgi:hypothetical protein